MNAPAPTASPRIPARRTFAPWLDPSAKPLIRFEGVTKTFGDTRAVDGLSLDIYPREFFALLGPSGCGKTTLMRILAGFEAPTEGGVSLAGESLIDVPPHRRPVNMMFQSYALFPHLSVWDNIAFGLRRAKLRRAEVKARVEEMLDLVQLSAQARRKPHQLSGGQRQRVALARSLAKRPQVLLLDEPLAALDKKLRNETQFELMNLQERIGITFLIVTHDQEEAMVLADRIAIMREGRIEQVAPPEEIYESPASRYVADFVGEITFIEGTVAAAYDGQVSLSTEASEHPINVVPRTAVPVGASASVAIRPEKVQIAKAGAEVAGERNILRGTVFDIAYMGDYTLYRVKTPSGAMVEASRLNRRRIDAELITWDEEVVLSFDPADAVLLDR
ncbi:MAG: ABC transporter ATP-binding protein [Pseudomonadota bacterium]